MQELRENYGERSRYMCSLLVKNAKMGKRCPYEQKLEITIVNIVVREPLAKNHFAKNTLPEMGESPSP